MGKFVHKPSLRYKGGEIHVFHGLDTDTWSYFEVVGLAKDLGYVDRFNMWWKQKGVAFKRGLRELRNDEDALELCNIAVSKKCEMEIYLEHGMSSEANVKTLKVPLLTDKTESEKVHVNEVINEDVGCEQLNDVGVDMVNDVVNDMVNPDVGYTSAQDGENAEATPIGTHKSQQAHNSQQTKRKEKGTATETSQQEQRKGKGKATQTSQQAQRKGKDKATQSSQQEQSSQHTQTMRVTRSSQQSQQTKNQGVGPSNTKNIPKKRKADTTTKKGTSPTEMGGHAHKRKLQAATSTQAEQLGVEQDPADPTLPGAATTVQAPTELEPTLAEPSTANGEENDHQGHNVGDINTSGEPSQTRGGTKG
ncbi:hypothetical protein SESBI_34797 [Sesbania bispinosa]|nr:hypothetical protein SESBI_34797 [Sesbania bispinosa]